MLVVTGGVLNEIDGFRLQVSGMSYSIVRDGASGVNRHMVGVVRIA